MVNFYWDEYDFFSYLKDGRWPDGWDPDTTIIIGLPVPENEVRHCEVVLCVNGLKRTTCMQFSRQPDSDSEVTG